FARGGGLMLKGQFAEAKTCLQRALDLAPATDPIRPAYLDMRGKNDGFLALEAKIPEVLAGKVQLRTTAERLQVVDICQVQQRHAAAAKLSAAAFAADPWVADLLASGLRYKAACSASLAAAGQGKDADKLSDQERADPRKQALQWLR